MEKYNNVSQDIRDQLNAKAEAVQIILTGIDNDIYSTIMIYCSNACRMWKSIERLKQCESTMFKILKTNYNMGIWKISHHGMNLYTVTEDEEMSKEKEIGKLMVLISLSFKKICKPTNNNLRTLSNTSRANQDNSPRINKGTRYDNQRTVNVAGARENVEQADWKDDTFDESDDQELEAHYMYMAQIQEVTPDPVDNSGPIFDDEPMHKAKEAQIKLYKTREDKELDKVIALENKVKDSYKDGDGDASFQLKSDSLPHDHAQTTKTYYKHRDSRIKKA
ncbi:hypothetical protein Tco_0185791 [Tanacetum coccineum]